MKKEEFGSWGEHTNNNIVQAAFLDLGNVGSKFKSRGDDQIEYIGTNEKEDGIYSCAGR